MIAPFFGSEHLLTLLMQQFVLGVLTPIFEICENQEETGFSINDRKSINIFLFTECSTFRLLLFTLSKKIFKINKFVIITFSVYGSCPL